VSQSHIAVGGENIIDYVQISPEGEDLKFDAVPGGSPYNVAVALGRQNIPTTYISPISTDDLGDILIQHLQIAGVKIGAERRPEHTSRAIITLKDGIPSYEFRRHRTAERCVTTQSLASNIKLDTKALHFGGLAIAAGIDADAWVGMAELAYSNDMFVSYDPNIRPALIDDRKTFMKRYKRILSNVHLVKLSDEDLEWLYPDMSQTEAFETLVKATSADLVILTKGADGATAQTRQHHCHVPAPKVTKMVDTVGAGDTFMATVLAALDERGLFVSKTLNDLSCTELTDILHRGAYAASLNCARFGCQPPTEAEIKTVLHR